MKNEPLDKLMFMNFICLSFYVFVISSLDDHLSFFLSRLIERLAVRGSAQ